MNMPKGGTAFAPNLVNMQTALPQRRRMMHFHSLERMVVATFDLCLECRKACKRAGPPWCRIECSSFGSDNGAGECRTLDMTEDELVTRVAYA
jgi:hypothetical protein